MLTLVSLADLITVTISIGLLFIHQIFMSKKMSTPQSLYVIYIIELSNIWMFVAIELHQKMPNLKMLPAAYCKRQPLHNTY